MTDLEFFKSLNYEDGVSVVESICRRFPLQYGTTLGLDGHPQIRPLEFKFAEDGVLYFDTVEFYTSYKEMQAHPYIQLCICDQETMTYLRVGDKRDVVIGYYLTQCMAEFASFHPELENRKYELKNKFD